MEQYRDELNEEFKLDKTPIVLVESNSHTYVFEINKKAGDKHIRKSEDYTVVLSKKVYMSFTSPRLENLVDEFRELQESYKVEQDELVLKVLDIVATYFPVIERASNLIAEFDVLLGFSVASTSSSSDYCRPEIGSSIEKLNLTNSRHPLIERINPQGCISNDCNMVRGFSNLQLITGPNMGGKSTYIRQIAINVLLAHIGCFIPCESAEIPILDAIIARVGASDHQLKGVSTFMAEMLEAA